MYNLNALQTHFPSSDCASTLLGANQQARLSPHSNCFCSSRTCSLWHSRPGWLSPCYAPGHSVTWRVRLPGANSVGKSYISAERAVWFFCNLRAVPVGTAAERSTGEDKLSTAKGTGSFHRCSTTQVPRHLVCAKNLGSCAESLGLYLTSAAYKLFDLVWATYVCVSVSLSARLRSQ